MRAVLRVIREETALAARIVPEARVFLVPAHEGATVDDANPLPDPGDRNGAALFKDARNFGLADDGARFFNRNFPEYPIIERPRLRFCENRIQKKGWEGAP